MLLNIIRKQKSSPRNRTTHRSEEEKTHQKRMKKKTDGASQRTRLTQERALGCKGSMSGGLAMWVMELSSYGGKPPIPGVRIVGWVASALLRTLRTQRKSGLWPRCPMRTLSPVSLRFTGLIGCWGFFLFSFLLASLEWFGCASARHYPCLDPGLKDRSQNVGIFLFSSPPYYSRCQDVTLGLTLQPLDLVLRPSPDMWYGFTHRG